MPSPGGGLFENFEKEIACFQKRFDSVLDSMGLQRKVYHSGAIVGDDVHRLTEKNNIFKISQAFPPKKIKLSSGETSIYSSHEKKVKINTLLSKFAQCLEVYSVPRPLCNHEVSLLAIRCASIVSWFPVRRPTISIIPKFHCLTYRIPEIAYLRQTVVMAAENCSESVHPKNELPEYNF